MYNITLSVFKFQLCLSQQGIERKVSTARQHIDRQDGFTRAISPFDCIYHHNAASNDSSSYLSSDLTCGIALFHPFSHSPRLPTKPSRSSRVSGPLHHHRREPFPSKPGQLLRPQGQHLQSLLCQGRLDLDHTRLSVPARLATRLHGPFRTPTASTRPGRAPIQRGYASVVPNDTMVLRAPNYRPQFCDYGREMRARCGGDVGQSGGGCCAGGICFCGSGKVVYGGSL